jgi:hypothetical protein
MQYLWLVHSQSYRFRKWNKEGNGIKTNAQLTLSVVGSGPFPGVLLITDSGAEDMNSSAFFIRINESTGERNISTCTIFSKSLISIRKRICSTSLLQEGNRYKSYFGCKCVGKRNAK